MNENIVYTTGVYDMFHEGHYNFLLEASKYGKLIVGVTSDKLVKKEKQKTPYINENDRIKIIENLNFVDKVILHENSNKIEVYETIKFTHCIIGTDWKGHDSYNYFEKCLPQVKFIYIEYTKGISTSYLLKLINDNNYHIKTIKLNENEKKNILNTNNINNYPEILPRNCLLQNKNFNKINQPIYKGKNVWSELECLKKAQNTEVSVRLAGWYIDLDYLYIITEKFGKSLNEQNKNCISNLIAVNILKAIYELHKLNIHHNDINAGNILIDNEDVKICDFGWSNYLINNNNNASDYYYALIMMHELGYRSYFIGDIVNFDYKFSNDLCLLKRAALKDNTISDEEILNIINKIKLRDDLMDLMFKISCIAFKKHNIKPYIAGGYLIGYLRNGKKIPWDKDFDFHMSSNEFNIIKSKDFFNTIKNLTTLDINIIKKKEKLYAIVLRNHDNYIDIDLICDTELKLNSKIYIDGNPHEFNDYSQTNLWTNIYPLNKVEKEDYEYYLPNNIKELVKNQYGLKCINNIPEKADDLSNNLNINLENIKKTVYNFSKNYIINKIRLNID